MVKKKRTYGTTSSGRMYTITDYPNCESMLLDISGRAAGSARRVTHIKRIAWNGKEFASFAAFKREFAAAN